MVARPQSLIIVPFQPCPYEYRRYFLYLLDSILFPNYIFQRYISTYIHDPTRQPFQVPKLPSSLSCLDVLQAGLSVQKQGYQVIFAVNQRAHTLLLLTIPRCYVVLRTATVLSFGQLHVISVCRTQRYTHKQPSKQRRPQMCASDPWQKPPAAELPANER